MTHTSGSPLSLFGLSSNQSSKHATHRHSHELFQEENINLWAEINDFKRGKYAVSRLGRALDVGEVSEKAQTRHQHYIFHRFFPSLWCCACQKIADPPPAPYIFSVDCFAPCCVVLTKSLTNQHFIFFRRVFCPVWCCAYKKRASFCARPKATVGDASPFSPLVLSH